MYDGPTSPVTQTFGLGLFQPTTPPDLQEIEAFYRQRGSPVWHEVCPLTDVGLSALLSERGYRPAEFSSVLFRPTRGGPPPAAPRNAGIRVRLVGEDEHELWARTAAEGWRGLTELGDSILELARVSTRRPDGRAFLAELDGRPIATGWMSVSDGVALLAGASTVPEGRKQGAQLALLDARLRYAAEHGCDVAMMGAEPGSASQRNAERQGFRIAYTRTKWRLSTPAG
jgi:GNAT superfamily N-acetyltransferase